MDAPGAVHHVMIRGIERRLIFHDSQDYENFLSRLDRLIPELGFYCFAWVLMPNHVHLALQTGAAPLQKLMSRLGTGYALTFNREHERVGHLFQNRYKSRPVAGDRDLMTLVTYIHANPLRANIVQSIDELSAFPWSGHGALIGSRLARPFEACSATLGLFADDQREARQRLLARMLSVAGGEDHPSERFEVASPAPTTPNVTTGNLRTLNDLIDEVSAAHGLTPTDLRGRWRNRRVVEARSELAYRATRELGLPNRAVACALGVSDSAVSRALDRRRIPRP